MGDVKSSTNKLEYNRIWRENNKEYKAKKMREYREALKLEVLSIYGQSCVVCGFSDIDALQIDHINNDGAEERRSLGGQNFSGWKFYEHLKKNNWPSGYQTLCANHNAIKQAVHRKSLQ